MQPENNRRYRFGVLGLLFVATVINSFDRASLSVAAPFIIAEFGVSKAVMGIALSAFFWTYVVGNVVGGRLADRFGTKLVMGASFSVWSLFTAATGLAQNITHIVLARLGVGLGEGPSFPTTTKVFAGNFPASERGTAIGINSSGARAGLALCPIVMAFLIANWGWRFAFIATGLLSLVWVAFWYFRFTDLAQLERAKQGVEQVKIPWRRIITSRAILAIIAVKFSQDFLQWQFLTWIPAYLVSDRGFSAIEMGFYTSLAFGVAFITQPGVGFLSDWLIRRGWSVTRARKTVQVTLQLLSATIIVTGFSGNIGIALFFMVLAISAESTCAGHIWTIIADAIPSRYIGSVGGLINAIGAIAGIISPILTGIIVDITGSFQIALVIGGSIILFAAVFTIFLVPSLDRPWTHLFDEEGRPVTA